MFVDRSESYSATHSENYIYCAEKVAHGLDLINFVMWTSQIDCCCEDISPSEKNANFTYV